MTKLLGDFQGKKRSLNEQARLKIIEGLTHEQHKVVELVYKNKLNLFVTGAAGTGKSHLVQSLIALCPHDVFLMVTSSTAISAKEIKGVTFHSFFGLTPELSQNSVSIQQVIQLLSAKVRSQINQTQLLVIDEISMISAQLFDKAEAIACICKGNSNPFGGIQLIVVGDFHQLPPIDCCSNTSRYAFESKAWWKSVDVVAELRCHMRQKKDSTFFNLLSQLRYGDLNASAERLLLPHIIKDIEELPNDLCNYTCLFLTNKEAQNHNLRCHKKLIDQTSRIDKIMKPLEVTFLRVASPLGHQQSRPPKSLQLTKGSPVITFTSFISLNGNRIVNGRTGIVIEFYDLKGMMTLESREQFIRDFYIFDDQPIHNLKKMIEMISTFLEVAEWKLPKIDFDGDIDIVLPYCHFDNEGLCIQLPILLKWGLTVHRAQGLTLDHPLCICFEKTVMRSSYFYVALSRVRTLKNLFILGSLPKNIKMDPLVIQFYDQLQQCEQYELL